MSYYEFSTIKSTNVNNNKKNSNFICLIFGYVTISCARHKNELDISKLIGTAIVVPYSSLLTYNNTCEAEIDSWDYKYVIYLDSLVCSTCVLKNMFYWEVLKDSTASAGAKVGFIFVFSPPKEETGKFINDLRNTKPFWKNDFLAFVDTTNSFIKMNRHIPENSNTHAFLLNKQNKVVLVGNAMNNIAVENLFFKIINPDDSK